MNPTRIRELIVTPIAFSDPPLLNSNGVHEPLALRIILQLVLEDGTVGLGESPGGTARLARLEAAAKVVPGMDVFDPTAISAAIDADLLPTVPSSHERGWTTSAVEVACLDAQGKLLGRPVSDLLGGKVRDAVPFAAYLFYKWAEHPALDGRVAIGDDWGEALDPAGIVGQARLMQERYGFRSFKLKGGVFPPDEEIAAIKALAEAFPGQPLRLDPNTAWTVETSRYVARELDGVLEYLE
ncbi:enolase C-terminal domain-like protein, partial [Streptomyces sp. WM6386]|uniref:enolase C-terminal domain-like protein n=1 Tax=Streptomyces sp. WM6386 TaxID=1415558 RepID=UPI000619BB73